MRERPEFLDIEVDRLRIGLFIQLDLSWIEHPFFGNSFKIADEKQLMTLKSLGLRKVLYCPAKSDCAPLPAIEAAPAESGPGAAAEPETDVEQEAAMLAKQARIQRRYQHQEAIRRCEEKLLVAGRDIRLLNENLFSKPGVSLRAATELINRMAESLLDDKDVAIHAINDKVGSEEVYYHALNVTVLSMMLARELGQSYEQIQMVGMGALFHDIGKRNLPDWLLRKADGLTRAELNLLEQHVGYGEEIGGKLGLPAVAMGIIRQHHEYADGSGYPKKLKGDAILLPARIVALVNAFDNLCNPPNLDMAMTPHETVSTLFAKSRGLFDPTVLTTFIRFMGVYPPGTLVRLSNDLWGLVLSVNVRAPLKPSVMIFDPAIPKEEAVMLDLKDEPRINISKGCRPNQLPRDVLEYLNPRKRITYYFDEGADAAPA